MYQNDPVKVLTGEVRFSYLYTTTPRQNQNGGDPKYSATLLIPKTDVATKANIDQAIQAAIQAGVTTTWKGVKPPQIPTPLHDGDGLRPSSGEPFNDECKGHWVLTASTKTKPQVVGIDNIDIELLPTDVYSGMYGRATIRFFAYFSNGKKGIGCRLGNIVKTRDGEPLAGAVSAATDFADLRAELEQQGYFVQQQFQQNRYTSPAPQQPVYPQTTPYTPLQQPTQPTQTVQPQQTYTPNPFEPTWQPGGGVPYQY